MLEGDNNTKDFNNFATHKKISTLFRIYLMKMMIGSLDMETLLVQVADTLKISSFLLNGTPSSILCRLSKNSLE